MVVVLTILCDRSGIVNVRCRTGAMLTTGTSQAVRAITMLPVVPRPRRTYRAFPGTPDVPKG